jgi:hypothetical protein
VGPSSIDPRRNASGAVHLELRQLFASYRKADPAPERVKPIPLQLLRVAILALQTTVFFKAVADLLIIGYFFLLRPGEHTYLSDPSQHTPFRLEDISFVHDNKTYNAATAPLPTIQAATATHLNFTNQKNGVKDEAITHHDNNEPLLSPLKAVKRRVLHLRHHGAPRHTPLHTVFGCDATQQVTAQHLTTALRSACTHVGPSLGIQSSDISARALRAGGAMALLRAGTPSTDTRLFGRWKSWAMLHYLHRSQTTTQHYATDMLQGGVFTIARHAKLPADIVPLVQSFDEAHTNNPALR